MNGKKFSESKARKNGFYLALAVCLTAVGIAAWSTYDAVQSYAKAGLTETAGTSASESSALQEQQNREVRENQAANTSAAQEDPEAPRVVRTPGQAKDSVSSTSSAKPSAKPTAQPSAKPSAESASKPAAEPTEIEPQVPVNAPVYERSSQLVAPIQSKEVSKAYSAGAPVYSETMKDWRVHAGTDYKAESGEDVWACANGEVLQTYTDSMMGNVILIEHGDYLISYCGVSENFRVQVGDVVTKGQVIGTVTAVPCEAGDEPHLHLEAKRDGVYVDPESIFGE